MKDLFVNSSFNFINKHQDLDHYNQVKIKYGLEVMYYFFTKTSVILILSYFFNFFTEAVIFNLFYFPLRCTAHGFHAKSNIECWIISLASYVIIFFNCKFLIINNISSIILFIISLISFIIWSPADTSNLPLIKKTDRYRLKKISLFILVIEYIISLYKFKNIILCSIVIQTININPIMYKLFKVTYNNYLKY